MILLLQVKRCVFNSDKEERPPTKASTKKVEEVVVEKEEPQIIKEEKKPQKVEIKIEEESEPVVKEEPLGLKPKKSGNTLFTITSNVKIGNDRYTITKIIEEQNEKKARILYEKEIKNELGKPKTITKYSCAEYKYGDENSVEKIEEKVQEKNDEPLSLYQQALDILCNSPYIHIYRVPDVNFESGKYNYTIYESYEHMEFGLKEMYQQAEKEFEKRDIELDKHIEKLTGKKKKQVMKIRNNRDSVLPRLIARTRQLSAQEIKSDKNVIKYIGKQDDEWYQAIIDLHNEKDYENKNKTKVARENIEKILATKDIKLYLVKVKEIEDGEVIVAARNKKQAGQLAILNDYIMEKIKANKGMIQDAKTDDGLNVSTKAGELTKEKLNDLYEKDDAFKELLDRKTFATDLMTKSSFTIRDLEKFLDKVEEIHNMSDEERDTAVQNLVQSGKVPLAMKKDFDILSGNKIVGLA